MEQNPLAPLDPHKESLGDKIFWYIFFLAGVLAMISIAFLELRWVGLVMVFLFHVADKKVDKIQKNDPKEAN